MGSGAKVIVGFDGREESGDALALGFLLASILDGEVEVATVLDYNPLPIDLQPFEEALRGHFDEIFEIVHRQAAGRPYTAHRLTGSSPAGKLSELAEELVADVVVIGSTHRGPLGRVFPGTVGDGLLSGAPCAVAVAPRGFADREASSVRRIGVGYDGGQEADLALSRAVQLAEGRGAAVELLAVVPTIPPLPSEVSDPSSYEGAIREGLAIASRQAAAAITSVDVAEELSDGDPSQVLCERSADLDLLLLGSRGYGTLLRTFLGGTASRVIREAHCPVLIFPRGASEPSG
jgi:nucleotide-binding universal stress UspA family protein